MQENATPEQQIVHHAKEFIDARDAHKRAPASEKDTARDTKHKKERALDKAVKSACQGKPTTKESHEH